MGKNIYNCELCGEKIGADDNPVYQDYAEDYHEYGEKGHIWLCRDCVHHPKEFED